MTIGGFFFDWGRGFVMFGGTRNMWLKMGDVSIACCMTRGCER